MSGPGVNISSLERHRIIALHQDGLSISEIAREMNLSVRLFYLFYIKTPMNRTEGCFLILRILFKFLITLTYYYTYLMRVVISIETGR